MKTLADYRKVYDDTDGWFQWEAAGIWDSLFHYQKRAGIRGNLLEIGVWHGKSAALTLMHTDKKTERLFLVDAYLQEASATKALKSAAGWRRPHVHLMECDSRTLLTEPLLTQRRGTFRWIHIDGEHSVAALRNDLDVAHELIAEDGVVSIDDFFNWTYPQLTRETFRYLEARPDRFALFLSGYGKAFLARPGHLRRYLDFCFESLIADLEREGILCSLAKTSAPEEFPGFGIGPRADTGRPHRGTDDNPDRIVY